MTSNWFTARQVQDLLEVDASTVYRMAGDGRLPAIRIGRQWRFPTEAIDALLVPLPDGPLPDGAGPRAVPSATALLPPSLVGAALQAIAPVLGVTMAVTDIGGHPLTEVVNAAPAIAARLDSPAFMSDCAAEWRSFAEEVHLAPRLRRGRFGFLCAHSLVRCGNELIGMVLAGGIAPDGDAASELFHLDSGERHLVLDTLPRIAVLLSQIAEQGAHRTRSDQTATNPAQSIPSSSLTPVPT